MTAIVRHFDMVRSISAAVNRVLAGVFVLWGSQRSMIAVLRLLIKHTIADLRSCCSFVQFLASEYGTGPMMGSAGTSCRVTCIIDPMSRTPMNARLLAACLREWYRVTVA